MYLSHSIIHEKLKKNYQTFASHGRKDIISSNNNLKHKWSNTFLQYV